MVHAARSAVRMESHGDVGGDSLPHNSVSKLGNRTLQGKKEYPGKQANEERNAEVGSNPTSYCHPEQRRNPRLDNTIMKDELPCKIHVFITVCKVISSVPYWHIQASSMSFSPFASSFPLLSLSLPSPSSSSAPSVYVSFCP